MKRKRYSEEKIISILKEHEAGASVPDLSRRYEITENTIYRWKSKFGAWKSPTPRSSGIWSKRTQDSSDCLRKLNSIRPP